MKIPILSEIPYPVLVLLAILMALAPFVPEPHLLEKLRMLLQGTLRRPVDIFDLLFHLTPALLLIVKLLANNPGKHP